VKLVLKDIEFQSWRGVTQVMEVQRLLVTVIPRFIHLHMPLLPLKPMGQSRRGVPHMPAGTLEPPLFESPHAVIDPSALRAAKANAFE
jgi:hypothetical protein